MRYRQYGADGPAASVLGFGVMRLPGANGAVDLEQSQALLRRALELGVNFFDSHHMYCGGHSESAIGRAIRGWRGPRPVIQTKTPFYDDKPDEYFQGLLEQAVEKLGGAPIDYLLFHSMNMGMFRKRGRRFLAFTGRAMKRGLIRGRGFSSHDSPENVKAFIDTGEFSAMLLSYNWLDPKMAESLAYGAGKGLGVAVMNPLGGGQLSLDHPAIRRLLPGTKTSAELGLRFVMGTPGVAVTLSGMSETPQLEENVRVAARKTHLTDRQRRVLAASLARAKKTQDEFCTSCGYCGPCPAGVDIPACFRLLHQARHFGLTTHARRQYKWLVEHNKSARSCKRCDKCRPKCPIRVPIPERLVEADELLG